jgi:hypothetical protein
LATPRTYGIVISSKAYWISNPANTFLLRHTGSLYPPQKKKEKKKKKEKERVML